MQLRLGVCALALLAGATAQAQSTAAQTSGWGRWFDPATAPFIPIPEVDTAPHSGLTLGVIPTWLRTNSRDEIERIVAPDLIHSQYFGWGARMRVLGYPSADTQWSVVGGGKQRVEREFDGRYVAGQTRAGPRSWSVEAIYDRSGTPRFFGLGNQSQHADETSYVDNQGALDVTVGRNLSPRLQLAYRARERYVDVLPAALHGLPSIERLFPRLLGIGSEHELQNTALLTRDTRDSPIIPHVGARYILYGGFVTRALGSSVSYSYFGAEARQYWALGSSLTLAWHAGARYMPSAARAPFWALSSLGGDRSVTGDREPLRADGADRYIDRNMFAGGVELRTRVATFNAFATRVSLELAPFVDAGKVFSNFGTSPVSRLHSAPGLGVRGLASPYVVGYVDIGFGHNRTAVFSGIDYPF
jgi:hypothetical protein